MRVFAWIVALAVVIAGPGMAQEQKLQAGKVACVTFSEVRGKLPVELGQSALSCFAEGKVDQGMELIAVLLVLEEYDEERMELHYDGKRFRDWVGDAVRAALKASGSHDPIMARARELGDDRPWMRRMCAQVAGMGPPGYWPNYLEGVGPAPGIIRRHPLLWIEAVTDELECDG